MSKIVLGNRNNTVARKAGGLKIGGGNALTTPTNGSIPKSSGLSAQLAKAQNLAEHRQRPLLVHIIVDLTGSRDETRAKMRPHEKSLAQKIMQAGGNHPVICKGVFHRGGRASQPIDLNTAEDILSFFDKTPEAGGTDIATALKHYINDENNSILSLGLLIGDDNDGYGDSTDTLVNLAKKLKAKKRPLIVAHQDTGWGSDFCTNAGPKMAEASGGLDFSLGKQPECFLELLNNTKNNLTATPDELKATTRGQASAGVKLSGGTATQKFAAEQAAQLLLGKG